MTDPTEYMVNLIFVTNLVTLFAMLIGVVWSIVQPRRRIWPPPGRRSWQFILTWAGFGLVFAGNAALIVLDWNTGPIRSPLRLLLGLPLSLIGGLLATWGVATLGSGNSLGLRRGFVRQGPYRFTRNPQYLGDMFLFLGLSLMANSLYLWVTHSLLILVFLLTPLAEELWLEAQYGEPYRAYRRDAPRFL